jgi:hypothetical protein
MSWETISYALKNVVPNEPPNALTLVATRTRGTNRSTSSGVMFVPSKSTASVNTPFGKRMRWQVGSAEFDEPA